MEYKLPSAIVKDFLREGSVSKHCRKQKRFSLFSRLDGNGTRFFANFVLNPGSAKKQMSPFSKNCRISILSRVTGLLANKATKEHARFHRGF